VKKVISFLVRGLAATQALVALSAHGANVAPQISGTPPTTVTAGAAYNFKPTASDADGDTLKFTISGKPGWASFSSTTGKVWGTPAAGNVGSYQDIAIKVHDGTYTRSLPPFTVKVLPPRKANYGHYFSTRYADTPADVAMLCGQAGVQGVVWRRTWNEVEPRAGVYDFSSFDQVIRSIANSHNPQCQLWLFVEYKSFSNSPVKNPCPAYLQARYSGPNTASRGRASSCFMWEPAVVKAYTAMMRAMAVRYDANPRVEGFILQESALGFNGAYSQDVADGGTYTARAWRDALIQLVGQCSAAFSRSRCTTFLNFIRNGQQYLQDVSAAISAVPNNRACLSGPDLLPDEESLYRDRSSIYEVLARHKGCRSNSAQNASFGVKNCGLGCIFNFAVRGTFGDFDSNQPRTSGVCVNSYLFWNHRVGASWTGLDWTDALPVIAGYPYGRAWLDDCVGGGGAP
jgi:hypothetical protein